MKKVLKNTPEGKRSVGKPRNKCLTLKIMLRKWALEAGEK